MSYQAKTFDITLTAGQPVQVFATGTYLRCMSGDEVQIEVGMREGPYSGQFPMSAGKSISGDLFEVVRLASDTTQAVKFLAFNGDYRDDTLILGSGATLTTVPGSVTIDSKSAVTAAAGASTAVIAAGSRRAVSIYNEGPEAVYIREDTATSKSALVIAVGGVLPIQSAQALYAYNAGASDSMLQVTEIT